MMLEAYLVMYMIVAAVGAIATFATDATRTPARRLASEHG